MSKPTQVNSPTLWAEEGDQAVGPVARVAINRPLDRLYSYRVPDALADDLRAGGRVVVPFGKKNTPVTGFCVEISPEPWTTTLKPVREMLDAEPLVSETLLDLARWTSRYYACPLGRTLEAMVPQPVRKQSGFATVRRVTGLVSVGQAEAAGRLSGKQRALLAALADGPKTAVELNESGISPAVIRAAEKKNRVRIDVQRVARPGPNFDRPSETPDFDLNAHQTQALERIGAMLETGEFRALLLHGVSGSGKTEVYIRAMQRVLDGGRQAILLVPEIALSTQIVHRLSARFREVAVIHSGLTGAGRSLTWADIAAGRKRVVIGTRSAVFAPCPNLGLIVVDEEQEPSYKNQQAPRFHTRDLAVKRAELESIPVVLGSATPSLETWRNCQRLPHYERLHLPERVQGLALPTVHVVDLRMERLEKKFTPVLSRLMERMLGETLARNEQAVLMMNRRGYATFLVCSVCKRRVSCPSCGTSMVFHKATDRAQCHHCGQGVEVPRVCQNRSCGGPLVRVGAGTQRVEEHLGWRFPDARVERVDADTMTRPDAYEAIIRRFEAHEIDVLVGTQMIAKGLDFPFVSFVGVINADTSLSIPDFRSAERTFQLVTQVAGRAGRAAALREGGTVVVQTLNPDLPAIERAVHHDYEGFAAKELEIRRKLGFPPYGRLTRIVLTDKRDSRARAGGTTLVEAVRSAAAGAGIHVVVTGPQPCSLARMRDQYRYEVMLRTERAGQMVALLDRLRAEKKLTARTSGFVVDVDPVSLL